MYHASYKSIVRGGFIQLLTSSLWCMTNATFTVTVTDLGRYPFNDVMESIGAIKPLVSITSPTSCTTSPCSCNRDLIRWNSTDCREASLRQPSFSFWFFFINDPFGLLCDKLSRLLVAVPTNIRSSVSCDVELSQQVKNYIIKTLKTIQTRKLCYSKDDRAMRAI